MNTHKRAIFAHTRKSAAKVDFGAAPGDSGGGGVALIGFKENTPGALTTIKAVTGG
ncbi:MAG: hypothetical protein WCT02_04175 [Candidatus Paceibacterota bacterium]